LRIIGSARRDPAMPLDRLRARNQLGEVRFAELRFSNDEAKELLTRLAPSMSDERIQVAAERADGWAASLQLVALAERSMLAQEGLGAPRLDDEVMVQDYVWHEVLAAEDPEVVEVLQATAVVDRVNAALAQTLTGRADAGDVLLRARARGLFVTRIGAEGWFEVHSLVRAVLVAALAERSPVELAALHARAAQWFQDVDEVPNALEHWLAADRPCDALRLLAAKHAELYDSGREATVLRTIAAIPPSVASGDFDTMAEFAWCHLLVDRRRFFVLVEQLTWWADRWKIDETRLGRLTMLQSFAATMGGRWLEGGALARQAMDVLSDGWWRDPLGRFGWNMVARQTALSESWSEADDDVREAQLGLARDPERRLAFEGTRALGEALAGRPLDALRVIAGVRQAAAVSKMSILDAELSVAEAMANRELGDRARAVSQLQAIVDTPAETMLYCRVLAMLELVQARLDEADLPGAQAIFGDAESLVETDLAAPGPRQWLARTGVLIALVAGDMARAARYAQEIADPFWGPATAARVRLAEGKTEDAVSELEGAVPRCVRHEVVLALLQAQSLDDHEASTKAAARAVELAAANGIMQTVASQGAEATELAERAAWRAPEQWIGRLRRAGADRQRSSHRPIDQVEQLTERERDVLRFLPSRLTVHEIADELYVSINTLKFHLKIIYRKLGVSSRAEAAEVARRMARGESG
jgi:LuxR family maltose regulon positive regulatory protein